MLDKPFPIVIPDDETAERVWAGNYSLRIIEVPEPDANSLARIVEDISGLIGDKAQICVTLKSKYAVPDIVSYAHALGEVSSRVTHFAVTSIEEGIRLRLGNIKQHVILLYAHSPRFSPLFAKFDLEPAPHSVSWLEKAKSLTDKPFRIHLWVDTGMGREGLLPEDLVELAEKLEGVEIAGLATHLGGVPYALQNGTIDPTVPQYQEDFTNAQRQRFEEVRLALAARHIEPEYCHAANSGAVQMKLDNLFYNLVRPGRYVVEWQSPKTTRKVLVLSAKAKEVEVASVKTLPAGWCRGYSTGAYLNEPTRVALLTGSVAMSLRKTRLTINKDGRQYRLPTMLTHGRATVVRAEDVPLQVGDHIQINEPDGVDTDFFVPIDETLNGALEDPLRGRTLEVGWFKRFVLSFKSVDRALAAKAVNGAW
jgi:alanine racemase